jgi:hypothetical protein
LFGHFVCPAWHISIDCRRKIHDLTNLNLCEDIISIPRLVYVTSISFGLAQVGGDGSNATARSQKFAGGFVHSSVAEATFIRGDAARP